MKSICFHCGIDEKEMGENGAPVHCAKCGCTKFVEVRQTLHAHVLTLANPPELRIVPHATVSPERAHDMFSKIHEFIDAQ